MEKCAALAHKLLHRRVESGGGATVPGCSADIVNPAVFPMALFIKGHGGLDLDAVFCGPNPVEHGGHIPVVPEVVRAPAVDGNRRDAGDALGRSVPVCHPRLQNLHVFIRRHKGRQLRLKAIAPRGPAHRLPQESRRQDALVLVRRKAGGLLFGADAGGGPAALFRHAPEIPGAAAVPQVLDAYRLQKKRLLVQLAVSGQIGGNGAF